MTTDAVTTHTPLGRVRSRDSNPRGRMGATGADFRMAVGGVKPCERSPGLLVCGVALQAVALGLLTDSLAGPTACFAVFFASAVALACRGGAGLTLPAATLAVLAADRWALSSYRPPDGSFDGATMRVALRILEGLLIGALLTAIRR